VAQPVFVSSMRADVVPVGAFVVGFLKKKIAPLEKG
jgi:hypothetical protein